MTTVLLDNLVSVRRSMLTTTLVGTDSLVSVCLKTEGEVDFDNSIIRPVEMTLWEESACLILDSWPNSHTLHKYVTEDELEKIPEELAFITLSTVYEPLVKTLSKVLSTNVRLIKYVDSQQYKHKAYFNLNIAGDSPVNCCLLFNGALLLKLVQLIKQIPVASTLSTKKIDAPLYLELGKSYLTKQDMLRIEQGDILMIDPSSNVNRDYIRFRFASNKTFLAKKQAQEEALSYCILEELIMVNNKTEKNISLNDIPLVMSFDVGELSIPLSEIEKVGVGYTLDLAKPFDDLVTIRVNNKVIGQGELVDIGNKAGVRVTQLFDQ